MRIAQAKGDGMGGLIWILRRYGTTTAATASVSAAHLVMQVAVLRMLGSYEFGTIAFFMVLLQFGIGLSNALVVGPYTVIFGRSKDDTVDMPPFILANIANACAVGLACGTAIWLFSKYEITSPLFFAAAAALYCIRWFGRTLAYTKSAPMEAAAADVIYSLAVIAGTGLLWFIGFSMARIGIVLFFSSSLSLIPFGCNYLKAHLSGNWRQAAMRYRSIWRKQSKWAVVGLVTTEATANAHSYIVSSLAGPIGFAPLAAAALLLRPFGIGMLSLAQLERPVLARSHAEENQPEVKKTLVRFTVLLLVGWLASTVFGAALLHYHPTLIMKQPLDAAPVAYAFAIWAVVMLVLCVQLPLNVFLQATGHFQELSNASIRSCLFTIMGVFLCFWMGGAVYSTLGVLLGQVIMTYEIIKSMGRLGLWQGMQKAKT